YAREVLSVLAAAGREEPTLWAVVEVDPETGRPASPDPEGWADSLAEAQSLAAEQTAWAEKHHMPGGPFRVFELRPVIAEENTDG
ncbi:MAG TPA: hypothetical protein VFY84_04815, partial [Jiangellales bacterium]|nr:hypothetical protein [Jiangellales bacterium]